MNTHSIAETMFVSKSMNEGSINYLGTANDLFWDGFFAFTEHQLFDVMPTEHHQRGWKAAQDAEAEADYNRDLAEDELWHSRGQW